LPDKAIDLMDEAASKLRLEMDSVPEEVDELDRRIMQLEIEREAIKREKDEKRVSELSEEIANLSATRDSLRAQWKSEKDVVDNINQKVEQIENFKLEAEQAERAGDYGKVAELRYGRIKETQDEVEKLKAVLLENQKEHRMLKEEVTAEDIAGVVSRWTGIPVSKMIQSEREKLLHLEDELHKRVAGQEEAIEAISDAIRRSRAGLQDKRKPIGSFIFLGTTGVGKTELAKALAEYLFNDENALVRIDMSEYQERHAVSRLIGAPPGYVGYDEGGQLTEAVRRKPYSVVLLDEIEKAHPDVFNILLQVLDDGRLTDNKGRVVNFKNTIIIMTSNIGSNLIQENFQNFEDSDKETVIAKTKNQLFELLRQTIRPEFLNRIDEIIMFTPLSRDEIGEIVKLQFKHVQQSLAEIGVTIEASEEALDWLAQLGYDPQFGARPLKRVIQKKILNELSKQILSGKIDKDSKIKLDMFDNQFVFLNTNEPAHAE
jgi:ATP-dependent Clp protease ATP-binding subunit ClpB